MEHILVLTDLSKESLAAVPIAQEEQKRRGAKVTLLYVIEASSLAVMPIEFSTPWVDMGPVIDQIEQRAKNRLHEIKERYFAGFEVNEVVLRYDGPTYEQILDYAHSNNVTMLILAKHGRSGLERLLLGSVTSKVVQLANFPVLVVPVSNASVETEGNSEK